MSNSPIPRSGVSPTPPLSTATTEQQLIDAQIRNQEAQAEYYRRQSNPASSMLSAMSGVLGTLLGALIAFLGLRFQASHQSVLEDRRWQRARDDEHAKWERAQGEEEAKRRQTQEDERKKETRLAAADLSKKIAIAAHSMTWVLWIAKHDPKHLTRDIIDEHDQKMNVLYSDLVAAQVVVAALDQSLYEKTLPLVNLTYEYDGLISLFARDLNNAENVRELGDLWSRVYQFSKKVPDKFLGMLELKSEANNSNESP